MRMLATFLFLQVTSVHAEDACIQAPYLTGDTAEQARLVELFARVKPALDRFPSLAIAVEQMSPGICFSVNMDAAHAFMDADTNRIVIDPELNTDMQVGVLLHEIRHVEQLSRGNCPSDELAMKQYAQATLALEADASAISLLVAWRMREAGDGGAWSALSSWPTQADIAAEFAAEMGKSGDPQSAAAAAFDQWYASEDRVERYYLTSCSDYLDRQDATHALPRYQLVPEGFLGELCKLPDGTDYPCSLPDTHIR